MSPDAETVLNRLQGATRSVKVKTIALDLRWTRKGADGPWGKNRNDCIDHRRTLMALNELLCAGLVEERTSGDGSRWRSR